jgi:hypothetical protein
VELVEDVLGKDLLIAPGLMMQYEELSKFEREKLGPVPAAIGVCDTLTSSVTLKTPDVTKLSWKPKCPFSG